MYNLRPTTLGSRFDRDLVHPRKHSLPVSSSRRKRSLPAAEWHVLCVARDGGHAVDKLGLEQHVGVVEHTVLQGDHDELAAEEGGGEVMSGGGTGEEAMSAPNQPAPLHQTHAPQPGPPFHSAQTTMVTVKSILALTKTAITKGLAEGKQD